MTKIFGKNTLNHILINRKKYILILIFAISGIAFGIIAGYKATTNTPNGLSDGFFSVLKLSDISSSEVFKKSIATNIRFTTFVWLSGIFVWLIPLNCTEVFARYFGFGYSSSYFLLLHGFKGLSLVLILTIPQILLTFIPFTAYSVYRINFSLNFEKVRNLPSAYKKRKILIKRDILFLCGISAFALFCGVIDAYVLTPLLNAIF